MTSYESTKRVEGFKRNQDLEHLLKSLNNALEISEKKELIKKKYNYPIILIVGPHRSGTTLFLQWLANTGVFAYPSNFMARFYKAPIIGARIQRMLTEERFNYRDEFLDIKKSVDYKSENGKTQGFLAPNEFWYFWRRYLPYKNIDYLPSEELFECVDSTELCAELEGIAYEFGKPFALKAMILNQNIDFLFSIVRHPIIVYLKRDILFNIQSALLARKLQYGDYNTWYSFKIREYDELKKLNYVSQTVGQIYYIRKAIEEVLSKIPEEHKFIIEYEDFCVSPMKYYSKLSRVIKTITGNALKKIDYNIQFQSTNKWVLQENLIVEIEKEIKFFEQ